MTRQRQNLPLGARFRLPLSRGVSHRLRQLRGASADRGEIPVRGGAGAGCAGGRSRSRFHRRERPVAAAALSRHRGSRFGLLGPGSGWRASQRPRLALAPSPSCRAAPRASERRERPVTFDFRRSVCSSRRHGPSGRPRRRREHSPHSCSFRNARTGRPGSRCRDPVVENPKHGRTRFGARDGRGGSRGASGRRRKRVSSARECSRRTRGGRAILGGGG